jgi:hypothetical protein
VLKTRTRQLREWEAAQVGLQKLESALCEFKQSENLSQYLVDELLKKVEVFNDGKVFGEFMLNE